MELDSLRDGAQRWTKYQTPVELGQRLVDWIRSPEETRTAVDICAGRGHLLGAARKRWPGLEVVANDLVDFEQLPDQRGVVSRNVGDGRKFAIEAVSQGRSFDIVLANPPFGREIPFAPREGGSFDEEETFGLLGSPRIESAMIVASGMLVGPRGALAAIVPETMVYGETFRALRSWLAGRFRCFDVLPIPRGGFKRQDLGLVFLGAYKFDECEPGSTLSAESFVSGGTEPHELRVEARRGRLVSSDTHDVGEVAVIHCGGKEARLGYVNRRCSSAKVAGSSEVWVEPGDIVVTRVGRRAGSAAVYRGEERAVLTDCMFRLKVENEGVRQTLLELVESGRLSGEIKARARGLGARFCKVSDVQSAISSLLARF